MPAAPPELRPNATAVMRRIGFLLLFSLLSACVTSRAVPTHELPTAVIQKSSATISPDKTQVIVSTPEPQHEKVPSDYHLDVLFDYASHSLQVHEEISYFNNNQEIIDELEFVVEAQRLGATFLPDGLQIDGVPVEVDAAFPGIWRIPLQVPLQPNEQMEINLDYQLVLPAGAGTLNWTDRQTNFIDWYPYIPPYMDGSGWLAHEAAPVGEHEVFESANFRVQIEAINAPASLEIAAPAPALKEGSSFSFQLDNARRFVWSASGQYEVRNAVSGEIPITIYYFNEHRDAAKASLETAKQALEIYSELFGPYPYKSLSIVDAQFFDGMESDGIFFLDQSYFLQYNYNQRNYLTALTAHEVAHNWWFGKVGNDQALEPWLDEALCIYSESLYYENTYPEMVPWWWEFRIDRFDPGGALNSTIYDHTNFDSYVHAVYMRGAQFLQALRIAIGDEVFFRFLHAYADQGAGQIQTRDDFFKLLGHYSQANVEPLLVEYFNQ